MIAKSYIYMGVRVPDTVVSSLWTMCHLSSQLHPEGVTVDHCGHVSQGSKKGFTGVRPRKPEDRVMSLPRGLGLSFRRGALEQGGTVWDGGEEPR